MPELKDYNLPLRETKYIGRRTKNWKKLSKLAIILHGLFPHADLLHPSAKLTGSNVGTDEETFLKVATDMYKESTDRIKTLEEKGFKLLNYISIISALLIYFLGKNAEGGFRYSTIAALTFLVLAILTSLRCIGIKNQQAFYIDSTFNFSSSSDTTPKSKNEIAASLFNDAVYNNAVADNTADILKAARLLLSLGIYCTMVAGIFYLQKGNGSEIAKTSVTFSDSTLIKTTIAHMKTVDNETNKMSRKLDTIGQGIDKLNNTALKALTTKAANSSNGLEHHN